MNYFAYIPRIDGTQPTGSFDQMFIRDLKTLKGVIKRIKSIPRWNNKPFIVQTYTHVYKPETYKTVYQNIKN